MGVPTYAVLWNGDIKAGSIGGIGTRTQAHLVGTWPTIAGMPVRKKKTGSPDPVKTCLLIRIRMFANQNQGPS